MLRSVANIAATVTATQQQRAALLIRGGESPPADSKNSSNEQDNSTADNATVLADAMAKLEADRNKQSLDTDSARAKVYKEIAGTVKNEYQLRLSEVAPADYRTTDLDKMLGDEHDRIEVFFACIDEAVQHTGHLTTR